jgi:hypothetical protein
MLHPRELEIDWVERLDARHLPRRPIGQHDDVRAVTLVDEPGLGALEKLASHRLQCMRAAISS